MEAKEIFVQSPEGYGNSELRAESSRTDPGLLIYSPVVLQLAAVDYIGEHLFIVLVYKSLYK